MARRVQRKVGRLLARGFDPAQATGKAKSMHRRGRLTGRGRYVRVGRR